MISFTLAGFWVLSFDSLFFFFCLENERQVEFSSLRGTSIIGYIDHIILQCRGTDGL